MLTLLGQVALSESYWGINIFFDGSTTPGISAYGATSTTAVPNVALPDGSATTSALNWPNSGIQGANSLSFGNVRLTTFAWFTPNVFNINAVSSFNNVPSSSANSVGELALSVPDPASTWLVVSLAVLSALFGLTSRTRHNAAQNL